MAETANNSMEKDKELGLTKCSVKTVVDCNVCDECSGMCSTYELLEHNHTDGNMSIVYDVSGEFCGYRKMNVISFTTQLLDLHDDCLLQIFKYLDMMDLASLCEASASVKPCAVRTFELEHCGRLGFLAHKIDINNNAKDFLLPLKHFGAVAMHIELSTNLLVGFANHITILKLLAKYCGTKLRTLALDNFTIDFDKCSKLTQINILEMMINLSGFIVKDGWLRNCGTIFEFCQHSLVVLGLHNAMTDVATKNGMLRHYPNLRHLMLFSQRSTGKMPSYMHQAALMKLLTLNADVFKLDIRDNRMSSQFLAKICGVTRCKELAILFTRKLIDLPYIKLAHINRLILLFERNKISFWGWFAFFNKWASAKAMVSDWRKYTTTQICVHDCNSREFIACTTLNNCNFYKF